MPSTFAAIVLLKESAEIIQRFSSYYHGLGAEKVLIYHDGPLDDAQQQALDLAQMQAQNTELRICDDSFWQQQATPRPSDIQKRQQVVYEVAYPECQVDWVLICDADEFVICPHPLSQILEQVPEGVNSFTIPPAEAVWGPGDPADLAPFSSTWYRRPGPLVHGRKARAIEMLGAVRLYGPLGALMRRGLLSHTEGKQFVRGRQVFDAINLHHAEQGGKTITVPAHSLKAGLEPLELTHFDAIGFDRWYVKTLRRIEGDTVTAMRRRAPRRRMQLYLFAWLKRLFGQAGPRWLFRQMYTLGPRQARALAKRDLAFQARIFDTDA